MCSQCVGQKPAAGNFIGGTLYTQVVNALLKSVRCVFKEEKNDSCVRCVRQSFVTRPGRWLEDDAEAGREMSTMPAPPAK